MFQIDESVEENAPKLFGKNKKALQKELKKLRDWMESRRDIFPEIMNDNMLRNFIIINKFNMEKVTDHIENYYKVRAKYSEFYVKSNPKLDNIKLHMEMMYSTCLPKLTENMERVTIVKVANMDLISQYNAVDYLSYGFALLELRLQIDYMVNNIFIVDQKNMPLSVILKTTPSVCYKTIRIVEKVFSFRVSKIYFINVPSYAYCFLTMLKTVMKEKLYERIKVCSDDSILREAFPKSMLPNDYGGDEKSLKELTQMQKKVFEENENIFDRLDEIQDTIMLAKGKNEQNCCLS